MKSRTRGPHAPRLDIRLLGAPEILVDGEPLHVDTRKAVAVLALLATDARPYARDELAALLWPDSDDEAARGALRRTLSTLRSAIGDGPVRIDRAKVELDRREVRADIDVVDGAARSGGRAELEAAAALSRGPFLSGFYLRDSPDFDDWRAARAVAVERAVLTVLDRLSQAAEADGDLPAAVGAATRRVELDPIDEGAQVRLMELLAWSGDRSGALRQYRSCVAVLDRELGVPPLAATTARYEAIRDGSGPVEPASAIARPVGASARDHPRPLAPARRPPMVGRDDSLATILSVHAAAGADGSGRAVVIVGEAGIGKTRLAEAAISAVRDGDGIVLGATAYPSEQGIAYGPIVDLLRSALAAPDVADRVAGLDPAIRSELARLLPAMAPPAVATPATREVGAHGRLLGAIADGLTSLVAGPAPGVLWLDDAQWLDASSREAIGFLDRRLAGRRLVILLAWRAEDLDAEGQAFASRIGAEAGTTMVRLDRLDREAVATMASAVDRDRILDPAGLERLVVASEGLPLYVAEALATPDVSPGGGLPAGVGSVLRERLDRAGETAGQVLAAASVIGRSFDLDTVRYASGRREDETVDAIEEATVRGLIRETGFGYDFAHGALRDLAFERISQTRRRLLHRRVAEALRRDLGRAGRDDLARVASIAMHERAAGRDAEAAEAYREAGRRAAAVHANREAIEHDEAALALGHPDVVGLHVAIGALRTRLGDYAGAVAALESAAAQASPVELAEVEWALGRAYLRRGDLVAADHHLAAAVATASDARVIIRALVDRSAARRRAGDPDGAREAAGDALARATGADDVAGEGAAHRMLGLLALDAGDASAAVRELTDAVASAGEDPDPAAGIAALAGLALAEAAVGDLDAALARGEAAAAECRRIGDRHLEAAVENHLADMLHAAGRDDDAMVHLRRAVEAFADVGGGPADPDPGIWMLSAS
jgi:DNA-binding SARP family transcriptional activator/tetratricopeptide (TPR) repeat protein